MRVIELIEQLKRMPEHAEVSFDTEGTEWSTHLVSVDKVDDVSESVGTPTVVLFTSRPHGG